VVPPYFSCSYPNLEFPVVFFEVSRSGEKYRGSSLHPSNPRGGMYSIHSEAEPMQTLSG
jgi:hypothetical protein